MNAASLTPNRKVAAGGLAGGISTLLVWGLNELGLEVSAEVAAALATIVAFAVAYMVPEKKTETE